MNTSLVKFFRSLILFTSLLTLTSYGGILFAQTRESEKPCIFDRIQMAVYAKELTLKEAVLLKAELLFAPFLIPKDSKYALKPGDVINRDGELTGFYKDVHRVFPELSEREKKFLKSASPDLEVIITQREKEQKETKKRNP